MTLHPRFVAAAMENKLIPRSGTYNTLVMVAGFLSPCSSVQMWTSPKPLTGQLVELIPLTVHEPSDTGTKFVNHLFWSDICCVAPESANQSPVLRVSKREVLDVGLELFVVFLEWNAT